MAMDQETARLILSGDLSDISLFDIKEAVAAADDAALESKVKNQNLLHVSLVRCVEMNTSSYIYVLSLLRD